MRPLHPEHIRNVSNLDPFERYQYVIRKAADQEVIYSLRSADDGFAVSEVDSSFMIPFWSEKDFAIPHLSGGWLNFQIVEISLDDFESTYIPIIEQRNYLLNIFPVGNETGFIVNLEEFLRDLREELSQYE